MNKNLRLAQAQICFIGADFRQNLVKSFGIGFSNKGMMKDHVRFPTHNNQGELMAYSGRLAEPLGALVR